MTSSTGTAVARAHSGLVLHGRVWPGGSQPLIDAGAIVINPAGRIASYGPAQQLPTPIGYAVHGAPACWIGPGIVDSHVHLAFGSAEEMLAGGVVAVRDLGTSPTVDAQIRHDPPIPIVTAGQIITASGGYPSLTWGSNGFARFLDDPLGAATAVRELVRSGAYEVDDVSRLDGRRGEIRDDRNRRESFPQ